MSYSHIINKSALIIFVFLALPVLALEVPSGAHVFAPFKSVEPVIDTIPESSQPIGLGNVANNGDTFSLKVNLTNFTNPVDLYLALFVPELDSQNIYLVTDPLGLQPHSIGMIPWKSNVLSVNEALFGDIPIALLPQSRYTVILLAVPAGTSVPNLVDNFYLWSSSFSTLNLIDLSNQAVNQLGGGAEAATAILLARGSGHSLENIIQAILTNSLTATGEINGQRSVQRQTRNDDSRPCDSYFGTLGQNTYNDITVCQIELLSVYQSIINGLSEGHLSEKELKAFVTAMTILASNKGYSPIQIHRAIYNMLLTGTITISPGGNIYQNCKDILCQNSDRVKVKPFDPLDGLIDFFDDLILEDRLNPTRETYFTDYFTAICFTPILGMPRSSNTFNVGSCPATNPYATEPTPNFQYDFSNVTNIKIELDGIDAVWSTGIPGNSGADYRRTFTDVGAIGITNNINYVNNNRTPQDEQAVITLSKTGDQIISVQLDAYRWKDDDRNSLMTSGQFQLSSIPIVETPASISYEISGKATCNHIDRYIYRHYKTDGSLSLEMLSFECDEESSISVVFY